MKKQTRPAKRLKTSPTSAQFTAYQAMYDYFNAKLFAGKLSPVLLNFSRKSKALGFFAPNRWENSTAKTHEISLNPSHLAVRDTRATASTLVHEMAHAWQQEHGKPGRGGYHNAEWGTKMEDIGLMPSDTAAPGGKRVGDRVSHYILDGGAFAVAFRAMPKSYVLPWTSHDTDDAKVKKPTAASKLKYTCPECDANAWGKPELHITCGDCETRMAVAS